MASPHETLAYCAQSLSMARISVFGGGNSAERDPPDKGHFVVQPTGSFQQPLRRCAQLVRLPIRRATALGGWQSCSTAQAACMTAHPSQR